MSSPLEKVNMEDDSVPYDEREKEGRQRREVDPDSETRFPSLNCYPEMQTRTSSEDTHCELVLGNHETVGQTT